MICGFPQVASLWGMDYRELMRNLLYAIIVGLASGVARGWVGGPDADLIRRVEALEAACGSVVEP